MIAPPFALCSDVPPVLFRDTGAVPGRRPHPLAPCQRGRTARRRALAGDRRGAAIVELAVVLPMLVFLFLAAVDFGRVLHYSQVVTNCARAGAMYGSDPVVAAQSPYTSIQDAAYAEAAGLNPQPTVTSKTGTDSSGAPYVEVTATWDFRTVSWYPAIPRVTTLTRTVRMNVAPQ
jgi:Flp pilus assembly protein TadG